MPPKAQHDRDLAAAALEKMQRGDPVPRRERLALERIKAEQRDKLLDEVLHKFPKKVYEKCAGRHMSSLNRQAKRYGIPILGPTVDLEAYIRWVHDLLAEQGENLITGEAGDLLAGGNSPALELCRREKYEMLRMDREEREGRLLPIEVFDAGLRKIVAALRMACETLQRSHGEDAADVLRDAIDAVRLEIADMCKRRAVDEGSSDDD